METLSMLVMSLVILGVLVLGVFLVTKRQEDTMDLTKEIVELLKKVEENTKGK